MNYQSAHQRRVAAFMRLAGQLVPAKPTVPTHDVRLLRAKLILEEAFETIEDGLGVGVYFERPTLKPTKLFVGDLNVRTVFDVNLIKLADGCADLRVVTTGTLCACGISDAAVQLIVDQANLRKFGSGATKRDDGKWLKPPGFVGPEDELQKELNRQCNA